MIRVFKSIVLRSAAAGLLFGLAPHGHAQVSLPIIDQSALEKKIHELVNEQRKKESLAPLSWDKKLSAIAREHSRDMAANGFFSHINSKDEGPRERATRHGYVLGRHFTAIGENIFQINRVLSIRTMVDSDGKETREVQYRDPGGIAAETVDGWMKSPGHRKNILKPDFNHEGVGAAVSEDGAIDVTEMFIEVGPETK